MATARDGSQGSTTAFLQGFLIGLREPSSISVLSLCATAWAFVLFLFLVVDRDHVRDRGLDYLLDNPNDFDAYASVTALKLEAFAKAAPILVITGGSTTRDVAVTRLLGDSFTRSGPEDVHMFKLTTRRQTLLESIAMLERIPTGARGVAVIGLTVGTLSTFPASAKALRPEEVDSARYAFRSAAFDAELRRVGVKPRPVYGHYLLDNSPFFLARLGAIGSNLLTGSGPSYAESVIRPRRRVTAQRWEVTGRRVSERLASYDENSDAALKALDRALQRLAAHTSIKPILVEAPINPRFLRDFGQVELFARHLETVQRFADERDLTYLRLNELAELEDPVFYDWAHEIDEQAVRRISGIIGQAAAQRLGARGA